MTRHTDPAEQWRDALDWVTEVAGPVHEVTELSGGLTSTMLAVATARDESLVLRLMTREPWRSHGSALTTRESQVQRMLADEPVAAPRTRALDATGERCGVPAHLMTRLPGVVDVDRVDEASLLAVAQCLATIHAVVPSIPIRGYQSWAWEAKHVVPDWATRPGLWEAAFALLRTEPPTFEPTLVHRDFQPRNLLWAEGRISGVVDWVETSIGPAWLDVAHCATNLAILHGSRCAEELGLAYTEVTGLAAAPYFDVMDVVGFLPPPGRPALVTDTRQLLRLEERLGVVLG